MSRNVYKNTMSDEKVSDGKKYKKSHVSFSFNKSVLNDAVLSLQFANVRYLY